MLIYWKRLSYSNIVLLICLLISSRGVLIFLQIFCVKFRLLIVVRKKLQSQNKPERIEIERDYDD